MINIRLITPELGTVRTSTPKVIQTVPQTIIQTVTNNHTNIKSQNLANMLDRSIMECIEAGPLNFLAKEKFHRIIDKALPQILTPENFLNKGRDSKVYRISDNFVAKVKRGKTPNNAIHFYNTTDKPDSIFYNLKSYYGEPLIKIGNVEILKNATPTSNFVSCGAKLNNKLKVSTKSIEEYEKDVLPLCASLPQESYDNFAKDLARLNNYSTIGATNPLKSKHYIRLFGLKPSVLTIQRYHYTPDVINPNNILIADNQFKIVDKLEAVPVKNPNTIYTMLNPLLIKLGPEVEAKPNPELANLRNRIFKKTLIASEKAALPLDTPLKEGFTEWYLGSLVPGYSKVLDTLAQKRSNTSLDERLQYIDKVLNV